MTPIDTFLLFAFVLVFVFFVCDANLTKRTVGVSTTSRQTDTIVGIGICFLAKFSC